jgi:hypothetical protein
MHQDKNVRLDSIIQDLGIAFIEFPFSRPITSFQNTTSSRVGDKLHLISSLPSDSNPDFSQNLHFSECYINKKNQLCKFNRFKNYYTLLLNFGF